MHKNMHFKAIIYKNLECERSRDYVVGLLYTLKICLAGGLSSRYARLIAIASLTCFFLVTLSFLTTSPLQLFDNLAFIPLDSGCTPCPKIGPNCHTPSATPLFKNIFSKFIFIFYSDNFFKILKKKNILG